MPTSESVNSSVLVLFVLCVMLLLFYYTKESFKGKELQRRGLHMQGFEQGRGLNMQGFEQGKGLYGINPQMQGYINKPVLDGKTPYKNDGLREIESSNEYFGMSCTSNKENCVSDKWKVDSSVQMNANQRKVEGMGDGDENQWSMDHNNIGLTIDSTLNEMQSQDLNAKLKCNDVCPSLSGMNRKWTDTALDEIGMGLGGFEMYGATDAKINN
jgi:hypothetical protein